MNFAMQTWTAPTRSDIDIAHSRGETVDVGVPSLYNMTRIRSVRLILWAAMSLVIFPLHFLFNSAVYKTNRVNSYNFTMVTQEYSDQTFIKVAGASRSLYTRVQDGNGTNSGQWEELLLVDLIQRYCAEYSTTRSFRHAVFVAAKENITQDDARIIGYETFNSTSFTSITNRRTSTQVNEVFDSLPDCAIEAIQRMTT
ncbi:hypothetical protein V8F06_006315 [Rhypophila decipiens]